MQSPFSCVGDLISCGEGIGTTLSDGTCSRPLVQKCSLWIGFSPTGSSYCGRIKLFRRSDLHGVLADINLLSLSFESVSFVIYPSRFSVFWRWTNETGSWKLCFCIRFNRLSFLTKVVGAHKKNKDTEPKTGFVSNKPDWIGPNKTILSTQFKRASILSNSRSQNVRSLTTLT